jgi:hypothetical protein
MQTPRWAAVAILAPIGILMIHSILDAHSPIGRTPIGDAAQTSTARRASDDSTDAPKAQVAARPMPLNRQAPPLIAGAHERAQQGVDGGTRDAAGASSATLPSVMSPEWSKGKFDGFTHDELREMAARCELRWRLPPFASTTLPTFDSADEGALYAEALAKTRAQYESALHALHRELIGDDGPTDLRSLRDALRVHPDADPASVHRAVAQALADGQAPPDGNYARYLQEEMAAGDDFQRALEGTLGPERAQALRDAAGPRFTLTGCDRDTAVYRSER